MVIVIDFIKIFLFIIIIVFAVIGLCRSVDYFLDQQKHTIEYRIENPDGITGFFIAQLPDGDQLLKFPPRDDMYPDRDLSTIYSLKFKVILPFQAKISIDPLTASHSPCILSIVLDDKIIVQSPGRAATISIMGNHKCIKIKR